MAGSSAEDFAPSWIKGCELAMPGNNGKSRANLTSWKPGQSGNPKGRKPLDPEVKAILEAASPAMVQNLVNLAINKSGKVPTGHQIRAIEVGLDRLWGKPESKVKVTGRVDFAHLLAEFTEQHKLIEGECEVLDATQDAIHSEGEGENTSNNSSLAE